MVAIATRCHEQHRSRRAVPPVDRVVHRRATASLNDREQRGALLALVLVSGRTTRRQPGSIPRADFTSSRICLGDSWAATALSSSSSSALAPPFYLARGSSSVGSQP